MSEYSSQSVISRLEIFPAILSLCKQKGKAGVTPLCRFLGLYYSLSSTLSKLQRLSLREEGSGIHCPMLQGMSAGQVHPTRCVQVGTGICVQGWPNSSTSPCGRPGHTTGSAASLGIRRALRNGKAAPKSSSDPVFQFQCLIFPL